MALRVSELMAVDEQEAFWASSMRGLRSHRVGLGGCTTRRRTSPTSIQLPSRPS
jgi:hypothetical protein